MAGAYKTPGVYIVEKDAFPNSVVEVATAVPAFIGHTEIADNKGKSLLKKPWRISSMAEFVTYFGGPPPAAFSVARAGATPTAQHEVINPNAPQEEQDALTAINASRDAIASIAGGQPNTDSFGSNDEDFSLDKNNKFFIKNEKTYFLLYRSMMLFFQNGGGACYIVSVGDYNATLDKDLLVEGFELLKKEQEPTIIVTPDAVSLNTPDEHKDVAMAAISHCGYVMKNRFAIVDIHGGFKDNRDNNCIDVFRDKVSSNFPAYGATYYPWLNTSIVSLSELSFRNVDDASIDTFITLLTAELLESRLPAKKTDSILVEIKKLKTLSSLSKQQSDDLHKTLSVVCALYNKILSAVQHKLNLLPPSGAMAGIYTMVDNTRGVWKAPANVSLSSVSSPTVNITHEEQEDLNVNTAGKSINAIRTFIGEGTLVWGARTLDGNSLDWRYVNVRRTMIMLEESIKLAAKAYVFEPNVSSTWLTINSMITNFLTNVWKRGGLAGSNPGDAFSVHVGLGETMTAEDILEGILRVTVLVALSRPAEFIEITFQQQLQKS
jgi:phage tail sheath protein FI